MGVRNKDILNKSIFSKTSDCLKGKPSDNNGDGDIKNQLLQFFKEKLNLLCNYGGSTNENPLNFVKQFEKMKNELGHTELMIKVKNHLKDDALLWFEFLEDEFGNFEIFERLFYARWCPEQLRSKEEKFWTLIGKEDDSVDIIKLIYQLKANSEGKNLRFEKSKEKIASLTPFSLRSRLLRTETWMELHKEVYDNIDYINSYCRKRRSSNGQSLDEFNRSNFNKKIPEVPNKKSDGDVNVQEQVTCAIHEDTNERKSDNRPRIKLVGSKLEMNALVDTGSSVSLIKSGLLHKFKLKFTRKKQKFAQVSNSFQVVGWFKMNVTREDGGNPKVVKTWVTDDMKEDMILGIEEIKSLDLFKYIENPLVSEQSSKCVMAIEEEKKVGKEAIFLYIEDKNCKDVCIRKNKDTFRKMGDYFSNHYRDLKPKIMDRAISGKYISYRKRIFRKKRKVQVGNLKEAIYSEKMRTLVKFRTFFKENLRCCISWLTVWLLLFVDYLFTGLNKLWRAFGLTTVKSVLKKGGMSSSSFNWKLRSHFY